MINSYLNVTVIIEWVALVLSLFLLDKKTGRWRLFILLLLLVICTETTGWYLYNRMGVYNNSLPFNVLMLLSTGFFTWFFSTAGILQPVKKWLLWLTGIFAVLGLLNLFFFQGWQQYDSFTESLGDIMLVLICCYFFFAVLRSVEHFNLLQYDYFWLATGLLLYCSGSALMYQFSNVLARYYLQTNLNIGEYLNYALNLLLYTCLIIAFVCRRKATRSLQAL